MVEVTNLNGHGFWILMDDRELFLPFAKFPWFEKATVAQILDLELAEPGHLYWPELDVDLAVRSIEKPDEFPLVSRVIREKASKRAVRAKTAKPGRARSRPERG